MKKKPPSTMRELEALHQDGHLSQAKQGYLAILADNPKNGVVLHRLGLLYAEEGDLEKAKEYLEKAMQLNTDDPVLKTHLANILKAQGLYQHAETLFLEITKTHPTFAAGFNNLGTVYYVQAKFTLAIEAYQKAISLRSDYADAYYNLGLALTKCQRIEEAVSVYDALLELIPTHVGGQFQLASLLMQQNKYALARDQFLALAKEHPFHFETQTNLGTCYLKLGELNAAKKHYLQALEIVPNDVQVIFNLGVIHMQQGLLAQAIDYFLQAVKLDADLYDAHHNLAFVYLTQKNVEQALLHFREALRLQPNNQALRHTIHILTNEKNITQSPPDYIAALFDSYADHFDAHLLNLLHYQVPQLIYESVQSIRKETDDLWQILDLGCGTGLCGEFLKPLSQSLVGVDLSAKMLQMAAEKNCYDELVQADLLTFLTDKKDLYDLIIAGDVLVYSGDLAAIFLAISRALKPQGWFIFNTEINQKENYQLMSSGRFAHHKRYLDQLAALNHFSIVDYRVAPMRTQEEQPVLGHFYVLRRA